MKFIHIADIHASKERLPQTLHILKTLTERCKQGGIDFILFAGDFWDSTITATKGSGFSDIISAIRELEEYAILYFIYGTPSHEPNGSLDAFNSPNSRVINSKSFVSGKCRFIFIPEPRRSNYITNSSKETDEAINSDIKSWIEKTGKWNESFDKEMAEKPLIVVYHGEVKGAVYQNGMSASSPTAIPKDLLQSLNADYYAFGHIHMPQEVWKNAWYSGSACPKDFGEVHDGCYNLVSFENGKTEVKRISFGLPTYETFQVSLKDLDKINSDLSNKNVRFQFACTKEERKNLNLKKTAEEIKEKTEAISVKLEPELIEGEAITKSSIAQRKSIVEKMVEYAKEKSLKIPKQAKELLQKIQDDTLIKYSYPQHSFELLSLSLRGAIGIRNGQHKEDYDLNFESFEDGVVCLCGPCGSGKTTLQENCHPYPCMLTRDGTLKDHFYLKDSHRILIYRDENGLYYKISMLIDGKTQNGKTTYFVETSKDRETWEAIPDVDGSLDAYKAWVNGTFGSIDVFLRTAFFAKEQTKNATDISDTTKSERMELLSKLAGTEHLKEVSVIAREQRKEVEKASDKLESEIEMYSDYEDNIKENLEDIQGWKEDLKEINGNISRLEKKVSELKVKDAEYQKARAVKEANENLYRQYERQVEETTPLIENLMECISHKEVYDRLEECKGTVGRNSPLIIQAEEEFKVKESELNSLRKAFVEQNKALSDKKVELANINSSITLHNTQVIDVQDVCPTCGQPINSHKKQELKDHVEDVKKELNALENSRHSVEREIDRLESDCRTINEKISSLNDACTKCSDKIAALKKESEEAIAFSESVNETFHEYSYEEAVEEHKKLSTEIKELTEKMKALAVEDDLKDVSTELTEKEEELEEELEEKRDIESDIKSAEKENKKYMQELEKVADKKNELKALAEKISAYNFIEDAFSNNGIPAIELRESAPEIADIANRILRDSYGNKFEIRFGSTSELKAKRKVNEDFNILVYDSENGDEKTIDLVSSGERIWIKQALFYAFSIVQMNRTGFNFRTRLIDESDGSLDGGLRPKYLQMVTSAHKIADSRVTLLISHSQEIKDICPQIINL